jgi:hypothetical protein
MSWPDWHEFCTITNVQVLINRMSFKGDTKLQSTRMSDDHKIKVAFSKRNGGGETMKKLMVIACVLTMVMALAAAAGAYTIQGGPTANSGGSFMISTANDNAPTPINDTVSVQTWLALAGNQDWNGASGGAGALNLRMFDTTPPALWTLAAYVESATQNPTLTITIYGANGLLADVAGKTWELRNKATGALLDDVVWSTTMISSATAGLTYTFTDTSGMVGAANAVALTLGEKQGPVVPEPGSMVAMLSGLVGFVGFGIRRRK